MPKTATKMAVLSALQHHQEAINLPNLLKILGGQFKERTELETWTHHYHLTKRKT